MWKYQVVVTSLKIAIAIDTWSLKRYSEVVLHDRDIIVTSLEIFGYLQQSSVIFGKCSKKFQRHSSSLRNNFGKSSEIFRKWSEVFGKSSKTSLLVCLYNKHNNTWMLGDMEFIFSCSHSISHSFAVLTRSISIWALEYKFHISARPCTILYLFLVTPRPGICLPSSMLSGFVLRVTQPNGESCILLYWNLKRSFSGDLETRLFLRSMRTDWSKVLRGEWNGKIAASVQKATWHTMRVLR